MIANIFRRWRLRHKKSSFDHGPRLLDLPVDIRQAALNISVTTRDTRRRRWGGQR